MAEGGGKQEVAVVAVDLVGAAAAVGAELEREALREEARQALQPHPPLQSPASS